MVFYIRLLRKRGGKENMDRTARVKKAAHKCPKIW
jgi:hypothetical protein